MLRYCFFSLLLLTVGWQQGISQLTPLDQKQFILGMYCGDHDNNPDQWDSPFNEDIGLDYAYLKVLNDLNFNTIRTRHPARGYSKSIVEDPYYNYNGVNDIAFQGLSYPDGPRVDWLDTCALLDLKVIVGDEDVVFHRSWGYAGYPDNQEVQNVVDYYNNHPAILGYGISDEPVTNMFPKIKEIQDIMANSDVDKVRYVNLFPALASCNQMFNNIQWATSSPPCSSPSGHDCTDHDINFDCSGDGLSSRQWYYQEYVDDYVADANPNVLVFDEYPVTLGVYNNQSGPNPPYYTQVHQVSLYVMGKKSAATDLPFWVVISPAFEELRWDGTAYVGPGAGGLAHRYPDNGLSRWNYKYFLRLMYGAKGLMNWARELRKYQGGIGYNTFDYARPLGAGWSYGNGWSAAIDPNLSLTSATRTHISGLNEMLRDHECTLLKLRFQDVFHADNKLNVAPNVTEIMPEQSQGASGTWQLSNLSSNAIANTYMDVQDVFTPANGQTETWLAISFMDDAAGGEYFWVMNKSLDDSADFTVNFQNSTQLLNVLEDSYCPATTQLSVHLDPGEGKLFQIVETPGVVCQGTYAAGNHGTVFTNYSNIISCGDLTVEAGAKLALVYSEIAATPNTAVVPTTSFWAKRGCDLVIKPVSSDPNCGANKAPAALPEELAGKEPERFAVYPNPSSGMFTLEVTGTEPYNYEVFTAYGQKILSGAGQGAPSSLDLSRQSQGIYYLRFSQGSKRQIKKLIVQ